jgi:hypothetical protein
MPKSVDSTLNVRRRDDGDISHCFTRDQVFDPEDYIEIFDNTVEQVEDLEEDIDEIEEEIEEEMEENNEAMAAIHTLLESEDQEEPDYLDPDVVTKSDLETFKELQQKKQQRENMLNRKTQIRQELDSMEPVVEELKEEMD